MELVLLLVTVIIVAVFYIANELEKESEFNNSAYHAVTGNSYRSTLRDKGKSGEYLIYNDLCFLEHDGCRFLFNLYLPRRSGGSETTELDVIAITHYGVMVFESKNYGGWIFGDERSEKWCQTLPAAGYKSTKHFFYNPIRQNKGHIAILKRVLEERKVFNVPFWNIIVFSDRCILKKMSLISDDVLVIRRKDLVAAIHNVFSDWQPVLFDDTISRIYQLLYPFSQAGDEVKQRHIQDRGF